MEAQPRYVSHHRLSHHRLRNAAAALGARRARRAPGEVTPGRGDARILVCQSSWSSICLG